jgi:hypothetical protein
VIVDSPDQKEYLSGLLLPDLKRIQRLVSLAEVVFEFKKHFIKRKAGGF